MRLFTIQTRNASGRYQPLRFNSTIGTSLQDAIDRVLTLDQDGIWPVDVRIVEGKDVRMTGKVWFEAFRVLGHKLPTFNNDGELITPN